jgi:hypothetical protein
MAARAAVLAVALVVSLPAVIAGAPPSGASQVGDGQRTLRASRTDQLDPAGERVTVSGSGYDVSKGIYVAYCVVPPPGMPPGPCGGGEDRAGASGASAWISSNPPPYGVGVATPYGPGGSFTVEVFVRPELNPTTDCRRVRCAIVTRNDHTRSSDRSQDLFLPITFRAESPGPAGPAPAPAPAPAPSAPGQPTPAQAAPAAPGGLPPGGAAPADPSATSTTTSAPAPAAVLSADGLAVTAGGRELRLSANVLDAAGDGVVVEGRGFDPDRPLEVALCAVPVVGEPPSACDEAAPVTGAEFRVELEVDAALGDERDCRRESCAVVTRNPADPADRTQELAVPVRFEERTGSVPGEGAGEAAAGREDAAAGVVEVSDTAGGSGPAGWIALATLAVAVLGGAGFAVVRWLGRRPA